MKDRKLAMRYARALLSALRDPVAASAADTFLANLARAIEESDSLRIAMMNPAVPSSVRKKALVALAERAEAGIAVASFLKILVDNRRVAALPSIAAAFHEIREAAAGIVPAAITTARPVDAALQDSVRASLEQLTGRRVRTSWSVDESLIGGVVTRIGSTVYDGSLKTQLQGLRRRMVEG